MDREEICVGLFSRNLLPQNFHDNWPKFGRASRFQISFESICIPLNIRIRLLKAFSFYMKHYKFHNVVYARTVASKTTQQTKQGQIQKSAAEGKGTAKTRIRAFRSLNSGKNKIQRYRIPQLKAKICGYLGAQVTEVCL